MATDVADLDRDDWRAIDAAHGYADDDAHDSYIEGLISHVADELAHEVPFSNEPQVFLAATNAAEDVLATCRIEDGPDGPVYSEEDYEKACKAARAAARQVAYRLLRRRRLGNPPGYWPTKAAFRAPRARAPRTRRTTHAVGARGDPSSDDDPLRNGAGRPQAAVVRLALARRLA
jgi:hypothetical protein